MKKLLSGLVLTFAVAAPAHAGMAGVVEFSPEYDVGTVFTFFDTPANPRDNCMFSGGKSVTLASRGKNRGVVISRGCWTLTESDDYAVHLSDRFQLHGKMVISKDKFKRF